MSLELRLQAQQGDFNLDVDLSINSHGVTAIFGKSGSGKTSLLRSIAGLNKSQTGELSFNTVQWQNGSLFMPTHERNIAYVFQEPSLFEHLSVKGNIEYGYQRIERSKCWIHPSDVIELLDLTPLLDRDPQTLSGGERQRAAIARALCSNPQLLLMDEPLSALDHQSKQQILQMLIELRERITIPIIYVSHALDEVSRLADQLVLIDHGRVQAHGTVQTILGQLDLSIAHTDAVESIVEAVVIEHDDEFGLSYLESAVGRFSVLRKPLEVGANVRLLIAAKDISITLERQADTSILNIFSATIVEISRSSDAQATVKLEANGVSVLAKLTYKSVVSMGLKVGLNVYFQAKSVALF